MISIRIVRRILTRRKCVPVWVYVGVGLVCVRKGRLLNKSTGSTVNVIISLVRGLRGNCVVERITGSVLVESANVVRVGVVRIAVVVHRKAHARLGKTGKCVRGVGNAFVENVSVNPMTIIITEDIVRNVQHVRGNG